MGHGAWGIGNGALGMGHGALGMGHWALVLSEVVGAASRREVLGIGENHLFTLFPALSPQSPVQMMPLI
jgi:hypothetical protein